MLVYVCALTVDEIAEAKTDMSDKPIEPQIIKRMYIK